MERGRIVRYLHSTYFPPDQIRMAWNDAGGSDGGLGWRVGFPYDAASRKYVHSDHRIMVVSLGVALVLFGPLIILIGFRMRRNEVAN